MADEETTSRCTHGEKQVCTWGPQHSRHSPGAALPTPRGHWVPTGRTCIPISWTPSAGRPQPAFYSLPWPLAPRKRVLLALQLSLAGAWAPSSRDVLSPPGPLCLASQGSTLLSSARGLGHPLPSHVPEHWGQLVNSTHRTGCQGCPPGHTGHLIPSSPPDLLGGEVNRCWHFLG